MAMEELRRLQRRWEDLQRQIKRQHSLLDECEAKLQEERDAWVQTRKDKELLVRLKEKAYEQFLSAEMRAERQQLDEVALRSFARSRNEQTGPTGQWNDQG
jgi:flagellar export protein FliJ